MLNLCGALACSIQVVGNTMGNVPAVSEYFNNNPKIYEFLTKFVDKYAPKSHHSHLIYVCRTRWVARIYGLDAFPEFYVAIVNCLEAIMLNIDRIWNTNSITDASGLFHSTTSFQFIVCLIMVSRCLEITRPLTKQLQGPSIDVVAVANENITLLIPRSNA